MDSPVSRLVDLLDPRRNRIDNLSIEEARQRVLSGDPAAVRGIQGSFALVAVDGTTVRLARSLDRPMRYFLAKRQEGPALVVADRIDAIQQALAADGLADQFHPSYTRMVPAHYVVDLALVGCPDPEPTYTRFVSPVRNSLPADADHIGQAYVGALQTEIATWLRFVDTTSGGRAPIGVAFSGGIDSGAVFLVTYHAMLRLGMSPARLKAFVLNLGQGPDAEQAKVFLSTVGLTPFLEEIAGVPEDLDLDTAVRVIEDYKPLDVQCAGMGLLLCRGIRARYPDWRYIVDGDGGDENLKDYPIEANPELTVRSVVDNLMLYQEGWGVGRIKHSLTYSGGLSRSYVRTYAPARHYDFDGFSPYTRPGVIDVAERIPFQQLTGYDVARLYALKGEIVRRGVLALTGIEMPVFPKRRFQHGAVPEPTLRARLGGDESTCRRILQQVYQPVV